MRKRSEKEKGREVKQKTQLSRREKRTKRVGGEVGVKLRRRRVIQEQEERNERNETAMRENLEVEEVDLQVSGTHQGAQNRVPGTSNESPIKVADRYREVSRGIGRL